MNSNLSQNTPSINSIQETPMQQSEEKTVPVRKSSSFLLRFQKVLLLISGVILLCIGFSGGYYLGFHHGIKSLQKASLGNVGISSVTPINNAIISPGYRWPKMPQNASPSPNIARPTSVPITTSMTQCSINSECTLYNTLSSLPCYTQGCTSATDSHVIAVNATWLQEELHNASLQAVCPQNIVACSNDINASWQTVKAICKNSVCVKSQ